MATAASSHLCSVQARPGRIFSRSRSASTAPRRQSRIMAVNQDISSHQHQTTSQRVLALMAAAQLVVLPFAGSALALDTPSPSDASSAIDSVKNALPNPFFGRSDNVNQGPTDASAKIQDSIKKSQGGKTNEAESLADKLNTGAPATGVPSTAGVGKSLGTTDGGL